MLSILENQEQNETNNKTNINKTNINKTNLLSGMIKKSATPKKHFSTPSLFQIFGVEINNISIKQTLVFIKSHINRKQAATIFFSNAHTLNTAYKNKHLTKIMNSCDLNLPDGSGIKMACDHIGVQRRDNVNGTDLLPLLCQQAQANKHSIYLLGAAPGVAEKMASNLGMHYPELRIAGMQHGYFDRAQNTAIIDDINRSGADILLVAMGQPMQEQWLYQHRSEINSSIAMAVGGLFDFYSNRIPRAPQILRRLGLEWSWRLLQEPGRMWRRYLVGNPLFLLRLHKHH
jgi:N-acetylglucosaminyldiphosphoundecaprenol N-acetyl-beta-D-mannosaminyltransferase